MKRGKGVERGGRGPSRFLLLVSCKGDQAKGCGRKGEQTKRPE